MNITLMYFLWWAFGLCLGALIVVAILIADYDKITGNFPDEEDLNAMEADFIERYGDMEEKADD